MGLLFVAPVLTIIYVMSVFFIWYINFLQSKKIKKLKKRNILKYDAEFDKLAKRVKIWKRFCLWGGVTLIVAWILYIATLLMVPSITKDIVDNVINKGK